jgi:microcystin-dependent protein
MPRTRFTVKEGISVADDNAVGGYPLIPVGALMPYAGATAPDGWLLCNGQTPSRTTYANLFAVIGTTYGAGDGSTFGLPDPRGRAVIGVGTGTGLTARALTATGGAETVIIASGNLPTHQHTLSAHTHTLGSHTHTLSSHTHTLSSHTHALGDHVHNANHGHTASSGFESGDHAHNIPRGLIATAGTNRAVVSTNANQATIFTDGRSAVHSHAITVDGNNFNTGGPSAGSGGPSNNTSGEPSNNTSGGPSAGSDGPSTDTTGNGGFANTALAMMNPFLALNYIIKY